MATATTTTVSSIFQSFLDNAVTDGIAPGFQCVIFDRDSVIFNGVSGLASVPSESNPQGKPFMPETPVWVASCTKLCISLIVLHIVEKGLTKTGFSMANLDDHDALVKILPEFKHGSGSLVTKVIEGFQVEPGKNGQKLMKLKDATGRVTLRMLLTHTAGLSYDWIPPHLPELHRPADKSGPIFNALSSAAIRDFEVPLAVEPDTTYMYSPSADWLGQFVIRSTDKNLRQLFKAIIFEPLDITSSEADIWLSPTIERALADIHIRNPSQKGFLPISFGLRTFEGDPPAGQAHFASACLYSSLQAFAKILQAILRQDPRILSEDVWEEATKDDLGRRGIKVPKPEWRSVVPALTSDVDEYAKSTVEDGTGVNLLQCKVATAPTVSGRSKESFGWGGLANTYFFIDPVAGIGAVFGTQLLPFYESRLIEMRDNMEKLIYKTLFV